MGKEVQAILNLLSEGVIVEGDIQTPRDIRIDGTLVGTVHTDGRLVLGPSSRVTGKVNSPNIDVFGSVLTTSAELQHRPHPFSAIYNSVARS